jgi:hypothetical protein
VSFQVVFGSPPLPHVAKPGLPADLDAVLLRCLAKNREDRYATCGELAADLEAVRAGRPVAAPRPASAVEQTQPVLVAQAALEEPRTGAAEKAITAPVPEAIVQQPALADGGAVAHGWRRWGVAGAGAALLLVLVGAGYLLWTRTARSESANSSPPAPVSGASREAPPPKPSAPPPAPSGASSASPPPATPLPRKRERSPAAMATLDIVCRHNFRAAKLEIFVDEDLLLETTLRGLEKDYGLMKVYEGKVGLERSIAAGDRKIRVRITSRRDDYQDQSVISGTFPEGGTRTLEIEFGKGSAFGVVGRKLDLSLR